MSEFFNSQTGQGSRTGGARSRPPLQANIALQITGHDLSAPNGGVVFGVVRAPDWMEGDQVAVRLTTMEESIATFRKDKTPAENAKFEKTRPTIEKLMSGYKVGRNDVEPMQVGGLLFVSGCTKDVAATAEGEPQVWKGAYAENYGNDASRDVFHGFAKVNVREATAQYRMAADLDILFPKAAHQIGSLQDLRNFFDTCMDGQLNGVTHNANAALRVFSMNSAQGDSPQVQSKMVWSARKEVTVDADEPGGEPRTFKIPASAEQTWQEAVVQGAQSNGYLKMVAVALSSESDFPGLTPAQIGVANKLREGLASGELRIEAIPGRRIPIVGSSLDDLMDPGTTLARNASKCLVSVDGSDNKVPGYVKMTVGVMTGPARSGQDLPDSIIVTKFAPDAFAKARTLNFVPTDNFTPAFTAAREADSQREASDAAKAGGVPETPTPSDLLSADEPSASQKQAALDNDGPGM